MSQVTKWWADHQTNDDTGNDLDAWKKHKVLLLVGGFLILKIGLAGALFKKVKKGRL